MRVCACVCCLACVLAVLCLFAHQYTLAACMVLRVCVFVIVFESLSGFVNMINACVFVWIL